ncbi:hypothetical protein HN419_07390 [Candidatus Woesearchaeota archaeon]|nr:hypothetical protein [Candidatus Woesearchaeota archaeon]MBT7930409.1 hypothetical protein [Candidatus Woesearchaeota archaeon]
MENCDSDSFLLTNKRGGYLYQSPIPKSKYEGFFTFDGERMFKVLESISVRGLKEIDTIVNHFSSVERRFGNFKQRFYVHEGINGFVCELDYRKIMDLFFDCKDSYDSREFGRHYDVYKAGKRIIVKFTKKTDSKEDKTDAVSEYELFVAIGSDGELFSQDEWVKRDYVSDSHREKNTKSRYVYKGVEVEGSKLFLAVGSSEEKALDELKILRENHDFLKKSDVVKARPKNELNMANLCAANSVNLLTVGDGVNRRLFAGLPWFFQYWTRDEMVGLKALILMKKYGAVKSILMNYLDNFEYDGRLPNRVPGSLLGSADGVGWFFLRLSDYIIALRRHKVLDKYFSVVDLKRIKVVLETSLLDLHKFHTKGGLDFAKKNESWMDTDFGDEVREGKLIELQALRLRMYKFLSEICEMLGDGVGYRLASDSEKSFLKRVKGSFLKNGVVVDCVGSDEVRPNLFLAYYIYPKMFRNGVWKVSFRIALDNLYLDWGALASISKKSKFYVDHHTGEDNKSYHRGDSWYWVNNIAAMSLLRVGKFRFRRYIKEILEASKRDILSKGIIGHSSEVSSAWRQESNGCGAQLWSASTFIELFDEMNRRAF